MVDKNSEQKGIIVKKGDNSGFFRDGHIHSYDRYI